MGIITWTFGYLEIRNKGFKNPWIQIDPIKEPICDYVIFDEGQYVENQGISQKINVIKSMLDNSKLRATLKVDPFSDLDSERIKVFISERPDNVLLLKTKRRNPYIETDKKFHNLGPVRINDITNKSEKTVERILDYRVGFIYHQIKENEKYCKKIKKDIFPLRTSSTNIMEKIQSKLTDLKMELKLMPDTINSTKSTNGKKTKKNLPTWEEIISGPSLFEDCYTLDPSVVEEAWKNSVKVPCIKKFLLYLHLYILV